MILHWLPHLSTLRIIFATGSPARKHLLTHLFNGVNLEFQVSGADETLSKNLYPGSSYAMATAKLKNTTVLKLLSNSSSEKRVDLLVTADTVVLDGESILEKPQTEEEAKIMLRSLSGKQHTVCTAVVLNYYDKIEKERKIHEFFEETKVTFSNLDDQEISAYVATGSPFDKAGGYGIQDGNAGSLIERIEGCYFNVVGFPIHSFSKCLSNLLQDGRL